MPDIPVGTQIFDLVFHPSQSTVYTALLTGHVKAYEYDSAGGHRQTFAVRPSKRSCRTLTVNEDGSRVYAGGKAKSIFTVDTTTGGVVETRAAAHEDSINRVKHVTPWLVASGDDAGVIKLWDPRQQNCIRTHKQHFDYISDFLWLPDKQHLLATSGDGTLSVMDVRSKKAEAFAQSEDQEDELLCATTIKGGAKVVVGTQLGILSIFNRSSGYGDCVDRVPGHPASIDTITALPPDFVAASSSAGMENTVLTGSSDGLVRAVQVLPTKLVGVVADHGELPVERLAIGFGGVALSVDSDADEDDVDGGGNSSGQKVGSKGKQKAQEDDDEEGSSTQRPGRWWVGSVGHDEVLRLTDLDAFFQHPAQGEDEEESEEGEASDAGSDGASDEGHEAEEQAPEDDADSDDSDDAPTSDRKRKRKQKVQDPLQATRRKKGRNELDVEDGGFFDGL